MAFIEHSTRSSSARSSVSLRHLYQVYRSRRALEALDAAALEDIGLTKTQAHAEATRSFWDAPQRWRA